MLGAPCGLAEPRHHGSLTLSFVYLILPITCPTILQLSVQLFSHFLQDGNQVVVGQRASELTRHRMLTGGTSLTGNALTRRAGGAAVIPRRVIVDVREFMSSLPAVLHQQGMEVVPLTLQVCLHLYFFRPLSRLFLGCFLAVSDTVPAGHGSRVADPTGMSVTEWH